MKFKIFQNRKPWSRAAEAAYTLANHIASNSEAFGLKDIKAFEGLLREFFEERRTLDSTVRKGYDNVVISTWVGTDSVGRISINTLMSTDGPAVVISEEKEVAP